MIFSKNEAASLDVYRANGALLVQDVTRGVIDIRTMGETYWTLRDLRFINEVEGNNRELWSCRML